jgi:hypothetical protein
MPRFFVRPDQLFRSLDGQSLTTGHESWQVEIYSVQDEERRRWVQTGLVGDLRRFLITLELPEGAGAADVKRALVGWLSHRAEFEPARITA